MKAKAVIEAERAARKEFGLLIREHREKAGLNQIELSRKLKYSTSQFISNWERGVSTPPIAVADTLIKLLKIDPKKLHKHYLAIATIGINEVFKKY